MESMVQALFTLLAAIIGAMFTMRTYRGGRISDTAREQLNSVYCEAFRLIEPHMYKSIPREQCDSIVEMLDALSKAGGVLCSPALKSAIQDYKKSPAGDISNYPGYKYTLFNPVQCYLTNWNLLCIHIDKYYDTLCKRAFLPLRSPSYRLNRKQCATKISFFINYIRLDWISLLFIIVFGILVILASQL